MSSKSKSTLALLFTLFIQCLFLQMPQVLSFTATSTSSLPFQSRLTVSESQHIAKIYSTAANVFLQPSSLSSRTSTTLHGKKDARAQGNERKNKSERVKKQKDDVIEVEATVLESLPNAMFRCAIDGAPDSQPPILATISGKIRKNFVKILVGDKVTIELSPYDLTRGRITFRKR